MRACFTLSHADPRRPLRERGIARNEVMFVRSGILSKYKSDGSGRRQIVALRFQGEGILPHEGWLTMASRQSRAVK